MGSRRHISRKDMSASAFTPKPKPNILQTRPFSNGKHARSSELPKPNILQTRPFSDPAQKSSGAEKQPPTPEALEKASAFGYNVASIPSFAPSEAAPIQAKLTIGEPGDKYEQEADAVAAQVVSQINTPQPQETPANETVQPHQDNQQKISPKPIVQRQNAEGGISASPEIESSIEGARGSGEPLADSIREQMEGAFGADFGGVKVHTDATSDQLNQSIQAKAFTTGQDIFFRSGTYDPGSQGGQELIAHELTHVVQQTGSIQRFEANEHKEMGDQGSADNKGNAQKIKLGKAPDQLEVTFGDITAMAGDFFGSVQEIHNLAEVPGDGKSQAGTMDEIKYVLYVKVRKTQQDKDYGEAVIKAVTGRYYSLAGNNVTHFTNPDAGDDKLSFEEKANKRKDGKTINNAGSYRENHLSAIEEAVKAGKEGTPLDNAMLYEAFASHFLTDAHSSGHLRTERQGIKDWWDKRIPMFWLNLKWWMAESIAKHLNDNSNIAGIATVQILWEQARQTLDQVVSGKGIPDLTFGDAISGALHDIDNEEGVMAQVGDEVVKLVGDGQILDNKDRALVVGVDTAKKAHAGVKASLKDVHDAYAAGKGGESDGKKVAASLKLADGLFRAEQLWPKALPDSDPAQTNKTINWQVNTAEELFKDPRMKQALAHFANEKADTLGAEISLDPPLKEEKTKAMKESVLDQLKSGPDRVVTVFREIINYTPGSATGELGGVGGHDTDDNAVEYWDEAKKKNAMPTLTLLQRKKLLKDVLDGVTIGEENQMVLDLLTSNDSQVKATVDHVGWRRVWDKLWGDDCKKFIRHCGPIYWKSESFNSKKLEVQYLADGRTNDIAQETIIIILRTCTPDEVRAIDDQVGGWSGLAFDLTGQWDTEFKQMKAK